MNELIKEIAREAEFSEKDLHWQADNFQKFAELIVQECAEVSKNYAGGSIPLSIAFAIKRHFGVEE